MGENLKLQFHHNVIEHLGLRLYQNRADKVVCELVSNSWDADATRVEINLVQDQDGEVRSLIVMDNGIGMARDVLQNSFLTIAAPRRAGTNGGNRTLAGRPLMGRKGLGKLAPFGICQELDVITGNPKSGFNWISLSLAGIRTQAERQEAGRLHDYEPNEFAEELSIEEIGRVDRLPEIRDSFIHFLNKASSETGGALALSGVSDRLHLNESAIRKALTSRFTVTLARPDFQVTVNGVQITTDEALPELDFRIPAEGWADDDVGELPVKFWVGFAKRPISPSTDSGIGVFSHGKIAQDRPFFFDLKGNHFTLPYIYGAVEADWIDDLEEDIISTDRSSIDWDHPKAEILKLWGTKNIRLWINKYGDHRIGEEEKESIYTIQQEIASGRIPRLTAVEEKSLVSILSDVSPRLPPDHEARSWVASALANAWLHKPAREMLNELWQRLKKEQSGTDNFLHILETIREHSVPEALSASVTFAQRAFALTVLYELTHLGTEPDLQNLLESFPWIIGPEAEYLTSNQTLRTVVTTAEARGMFARQSDQSAISDAIKPDFVFLSDQIFKNILVVELKSPQIELTLSNREQLNSYLTFLEGKYPSANLKGILIGNAPGEFRNRRTDVEIKSWSDVFLQARSSYTNIIASMLGGYAEDASDPRIEDVQVFGGKAVWDMLKVIAEKDGELKRLIDRHDSAALLPADARVGNKAIAAPLLPATASIVST